MKDLTKMCAADLRVIARENNMPGAWKATKPQMIEFLESINYEENEPEEPHNEPEEVEADNHEANVEEGTEDESEAKEVKRPSLGIKEIEFNGKSQSLKAWAEELEMPWPTLYDRINRNGWTVEEALTIPLGGRRKKRV